VLPGDLLETATVLATVGTGKPKQTHLRRAVSTTYYAMFHALARCCADTLIGTAPSARNHNAWKQAYRALEHGFAGNSCRKKIGTTFPIEIQNFAIQFYKMQEKRHRADYDPDERVQKSTVLTDIAAVRVVINDLKKVPIKHRRAFAASVIFKERT
jgi:uncharacterized protein (UPF0332 family)